MTRAEQKLWGILGRRPRFRGTSTAETVERHRELQDDRIRVYRSERAERALREYQPTPELFL